MGIKIGSNVKKLAQRDSKSTGLLPSVIEAQWQADEGVASTSQWPGNNPAGIKPGNSTVDTMSIGTNPNGFLVFPNAQTGARAYAYLLNNDPNYAGLRKTITNLHHSSAHMQMVESARIELNAIAASPWDANHYTANGVKGKKLFGAYTAITDKHAVNSQNGVGYAAKTAIVGSGQNAKSGVTKPVQSLGHLLGAPNLNFWQILIAVVGVIFIGLLLYRIFTH